MSCLRVGGCTPLTWHIYLQNQWHMDAACLIEIHRHTLTKVYTSTRATKSIFNVYGSFMLASLCCSAAYSLLLNEFYDYFLHLPPLPSALVGIYWDSNMHSMLILRNRLIFSDAHLKMPEVLYFKVISPDGHSAFDRIYGV